MTTRTFFLFVSPLLMALIFMTFSQLRLPGPELYWDDEVRDEVQEIVARRYLEPLDAEAEQALFDASMRAYVGTLDPFSRYFTPDERQSLEADTSGSFAGVGVQVRMTGAGMLVVAVYRNGPADRAGLEPGDLVTQVDDTSIVGMPLDQSITLVKGPEKSDVTLWIVRDAKTGEESRAEENRRDGRSAEAVPKTVTRGLVGLDTVPAVRLLVAPDGLGGGVAYVRVAQFSETTPQEVRSALDDLIEGQGASSIVLDLRENLGGVVSAAVDLAGLFLPDDELVCVTRSRDGVRPYTVDRERTERVASQLLGPGRDADDVRRAEGDASAPFDQPLVVLVDANSASASEILAGALQDHGRAVLVGERSYGKFLVQTLVELRSSEALVKVTTARYETPRGRSGQRNERTGVRGGIMPDVRVPLTDLQRRSVFEAFREQAGPRWRVLDERDGSPSAADSQLNAALDLLREGRPPAEPFDVVTIEQG